MALLDVREVSKSFGAIRAVNGISFSVQPGEVVGLMGDNGAGKSTMVKLIAGNFPPTDGEIAVDGEVCHFHRPIEARAKGKFKNWDDFVKRGVVPSNAEAAIKDLVKF